MPRLHVRSDGDLEARRNAAISTDAPTASVTCLQCGQPNAMQQRFCVGCGESLRHDCPTCKAEIPLGASFCGSCGTNVARLAEQEAEHSTRILEEARTFAAEDNYLGAMALLRTLNLGHTKQLTPTRREAAELLAEYSAEFDRLTTLARTLLAAAEEHYTRNAYAEVVETLKPVPRTFRSPEMKNLFRAAWSRQQEVESLSGEIKLLVEQQKVLELSGKLERLLILKPLSQSAIKLAQKVGNEICKKAKQKLAAGKPERARELLDCVPATARTSEVLQLTDRVRELCWLLDDLRNAAVIDRTLMVVAERLLKQLPEDEEVQRLTNDLQKRARTKPEDPRWAAPNWASPPANTSLGVPIDWLGGTSRIQVVQPEVRETFAQHPGRFFVACGLALQALGLGPIQNHLLPESARRQGLFSAWTGRGRAAKVAWGLDLNTSGLKAVKLVADEAQRVTLAACEFIRHEGLEIDASTNAGQELSGSTIDKFLSLVTPGRDERVGANLPGHVVFSKMFSMPALASAKEKQAEPMIAYEMQQQVPFPLDELVWKTEVFEPTDPESCHRVFAMAVNERQALDRVETFRKRGLRLDVLQADGAALHNWAHHEFFEERSDASNSGPTESIGLLDVGADSTTFVASSRTGYWFRSFNVAGIHFNRALVRELSLTHLQAETVKCDPARARQMHRMFASFETTWAQLGSEVRRSCELLSKLSPGTTISHLYGLGGAFQLHGLLRFLRTGNGKW